MFEKFELSTIWKFIEVFVLCEKTILTSENLNYNQKNIQEFSAFCS